MKNKKAGAGIRKFLSGSGKLSARFRVISTVIFVCTLCVMVAVLRISFAGIIDKISRDTASRYAVSSSEVLSSHLEKELGLMSKAARSPAVINWLQDEGSKEKKRLAYEEMQGVVHELYSLNLYVGVEASLNEYQFDNNYPEYDIQPLASFDENRREDDWYFKCVQSDRDYLLSIDIDHVMQRKRVWIDYKVVKDGVTVGVIATGLEFSHIIGELFSRYHDEMDMRGLIVGADGVIHMDSNLIDDRGFLYQSLGVSLEDGLQNSYLADTVKSGINKTGEYFTAPVDASVIKISGNYRYVTIAPVKFTDWSSVILYDSAPVIDMSLFGSAAFAVLILLVIFTLSVSFISYRLIFMPLGKLEESVALLKENRDAKVYGTERDDELGDLSNTIQDLFTKANYDALTGIHNRRFMESSLEYLMALLSRSEGLLSVIMVDVDYFKKYNDTYGHEQGDVCLKAVAQALNAEIAGRTDFTARYGGEEFIAVLPNTDEDGARKTAEGFLARVRELNIPHAKNSASDCVTVSAGVTTGKVTCSQSWAEYVKKADDALYMSKQNGRGKYTFLGC